MPKSFLDPRVADNNQQASPPVQSHVLICQPRYHRWLSFSNKFPTRVGKQSYNVRTDKANCAKRDCVNAIETSDSYPHFSPLLDTYLPHGLASPRNNQHSYPKVRRLGFREWIFACFGEDHHSSWVGTDGEISIRQEYRRKDPLQKAALLGGLA